MKDATAADVIGKEHAEKVKQLSLDVYNAAHEYALGRGIIIADTKLEFGVAPDTNEVVLCDEVLTPDSSRFWPAASYGVGRSNASFDKQPLRDWLTEHGLKGKEGVEMPPDVVDGTKQRYREAYEKPVSLSPISLAARAESDAHSSRRPC